MSAAAPASAPRAPRIHNPVSFGTTLDSLLDRASFAGQMFKTGILKQRIPIVAVLVVNNVCNLKCAYCFGDYPAREVPDITLADIKSLVDELHAMGTRRMLIHGGETLMRDDIGEIVRHIKSKRTINLSMVTNGIYLRKRLEDIRPVDSLCISLDGAKEGNDINRGKGTYKAIVDAIHLAKAEGFRLRINAVVTKYTMDDVPHLAELAKDLDIQLQFAFLYKHLSEKNRHFELTEEEFRGVVQRVLEYKEKGYPIFISKKTLKHILDWPVPYEKVRLDKSEFPPGFDFKCHWGDQIVVIDGDGFVYPCFQLNEVFPAKNFLKVGFKAAYDHLATNTCQACYQPTNTDFSYLFSLNPSVWLDQAAVNIREVFQAYRSGRKKKAVPASPK